MEYEEAEEDRDESSDSGSDWSVISGRTLVDIWSPFASPIFRNTMSRDMSRCGGVVAAGSGDGLSDSMINVETCTILRLLVLET